MNSSSNTDTFRGKRILALDDSPEITCLIRQFFGAWGARVDCIDDGSEAMALLQMELYDLILLDLIMPRPDGWDVLSFLQQMQPECLDRTILLTGGPCPGDRVHMREGKTVPVVYKPFRLEQLQQTALHRMQRGVQAA